MAALTKAPDDGVHVSITGTACELNFNGRNERQKRSWLAPLLKPHVLVLMCERKSINQSWDKPAIRSLMYSSGTAKQPRVHKAPINQRHRYSWFFSMFICSCSRRVTATHQSLEHALPVARLSFCKMLSLRSSAAISTTTVGSLYSADITCTVVFSAVSITM